MRAPQYPWPFSTVEVVFQSASVKRCPLRGFAASAPLDTAEQAAREGCALGARATERRGGGGEGARLRTSW